MRLLIQICTMSLLLGTASLATAHPRHDNAAGRCIVQRSPERAEAALRLAIDNSRWDRIRDLVFQADGCAVGEAVSIDPHVAAGGIAEGLLIAGVAPSSPIELVPVEPDLALTSWGFIARCINLANVAGVTAVLQTPVGSATERHALSALLTATSQCMEARLVRQLASPTQRHRFRATLAMTKWAWFAPARNTNA